VNARFSTTRRCSKAKTTSRGSRRSLDPYTPEPGPGPGERRAFRLLPLVWIVVLVLAGIILYAVLR
jgi:hypothetical protein